MPCPDNGQIKISDLVAEFGGSPPHAMSEYYRNAGLVPGNNTNIPTSGQFGLTNCYSAVNEIQHTHSDGDTHQDYATIFGSNWASTVPKRVIIPSGVTVGGTSTHAINVPSGMGGTLVMDISGNVYGGGGAANGGNGGNAINCTHTNGVTINLNSGGNIKAGGGGGGQGGAGGTGGNGGAGGAGGQGRNTFNGTYISKRRWYEPNCTGHTFAQQLPPCCNNSTFWSTTGNGHHYANRTGSYNSPSVCGYGYNDLYLCGWCEAYSYNAGGAGGAGGSSGGAGGAGGAGGVGQGYNQSNASGSGGSSGSGGGSGSSGASGGTNAGAGGTGGSRGSGGQGGTGGTGGTFGNSGGSGGTGSSGAGGNSGSSGANGNYANGSSGSGGSSGSSGSGGSGGGAAGYYIYNRGSITFNNSGTVAGQ